MALPNYVIQKNIRADSDDENVVLLQSSTTRFTYEELVVEIEPDAAVDGQVILTMLEEF